jgi:hypothetical protein
MNGNHICQKCRNVWPNKREEPSGNSGDLIAERDGKIRELSAMVERLKNCWNCDKADARCSYFEGPVCERWEEEKK